MPSTETDGTVQMDRNLGSWTIMVSALALHNIEEWMRDLPAWTTKNTALPEWLAAYAHQGFGLGLAIVTTMPVIAASVIRRTVPQAEPTWLSLFAWVLILNALWHGVLSIATWTSMPGIFTAILLLLPASLYVLPTLPPRQRVGSIILWAAFVMVATTVGTLALAAAISELVRA